MLPEGYEIRPIGVGDGPAVAAAYRRNRDHLGRWDPDRPARFYSDEGQVEDVAKHVVARENDRRYVFLLWYDGAVAGRVVLDNLIRGVMQGATVGYWVDHDHLRKGLAVGLVEHVAAAATELGLHRLEAGTMLANVASQGVLKRAGFTEYGVVEKFLFLNGEWRDHVLFQRILHDNPLELP